MKLLDEENGTSTPYKGSYRTRRLITGNEIRECRMNRRLSFLYDMFIYAVGIGVILMIGWAVTEAVTSNETVIAIQSENMSVEEINARLVKENEMLRWQLENLQPSDDK